MQTQTSSQENERLLQQTERNLLVIEDTQAKNELLMFNKILAEKNEA
jgi:hypothetical protein